MRWQILSASFSEYFVGRPLFFGADVLVIQPPKKANPEKAAPPGVQSAAAVNSFHTKKAARGVNLSGFVTARPFPALGIGERMYWGGAY